jgi:hypothetical protein
MIEILPPLEKYNYDTLRILAVKCYIDNSVHMWSCIRNINNHFKVRGKIAPSFIGPFKILEKRGEVAYQLELPP